MKLESYAREWMEQQNFIKSTRKTVRQALEVYIFSVIGDKEISDITEVDIDTIFQSERFFDRVGDFCERLYRVLDELFNEQVEKNLIPKHPIIHIYKPIVFLMRRRFSMEEISN